MATQDNQMNPKIIRPNIFLSIIGWLFLVIVAFAFSRPTLLFPISFVPVTSILLAYALYQEHPSFRRVAIFMAVSSICFCIYTFILSVKLDVLPGNLLDLQFNYAIMLVLNGWLFVVISMVITTFFILVKIIHKHSSAMIMSLANIVLFIAGFVVIRIFIMNIS